MEHVFKRRIARHVLLPRIQHQARLRVCFVPQRNENCMWGVWVDVCMCVGVRVCACECVNLLKKKVKKNN